MKNRTSLVSTLCRQLRRPPLHHESKRQEARPTIHPHKILEHYLQPTKPTNIYIRALSLTFESKSCKRIESLHGRARKRRDGESAAKRLQTTALMNRASPQQERTGERQAGAGTEDEAAHSKTQRSRTWATRNQEV